MGYPLRVTLPRRLPSGALLALAAAACAEPGATSGAAADTSDTAADVAVIEPVALEGAPLLRRLSLDLRGVLPSAAELAQLEADPASLDALVGAFLDDPRFEEQFAAAFAERWLTRADSFTLQPVDLGLPMEEGYTATRSIGQEAPRLAAWIAAQDHPWDEVVTGEFTRVDALLLANWPVEAVDDEVNAAGWRTARYVDGRPAMGVLATNGLWQRYSTSPSNLQRHRAAAISKLFLCSDYLTRPVTFSSASFRDSTAETSARSVPDCVGCHASLDPLASSLFGFWWFDRFLREEEISYHPERVGLGEYYLGVSPGWYGQPLAGPSELGPTLAADPRFARCAVRSFAEVFWKREVSVEDFDTISALVAAFEADGRHPKALVRAVIDTPAYRMGAVRGEIPAGEEGRWPTRRLLSAAQLASAVEDLSGFRWSWEGAEQLDNDLVGYRVMVGGVDGESVVQPLAVPSVATLVVIRALAEAGADAIVTRDLVQGAGALLTVEAGALPGDPAFDAQLDTIYLRFFARLPSAEERQGDGALFTEVAAVSSPEEAWMALLSTLFRDPAFWSY